MPFPIPNSGGGELRIDYPALGKIMRSPGVQALLNVKATAMLAALSSSGRGWTARYTSDRAVVAITVGIRGGAENAELKYGALSDAAASAGLEIKFKGGG